jgi:hypothetical protein
LQNRLNTNFGSADSFDFKSWKISGSSNSPNSLSMDNNNKDISYLIAIYPCIGIDSCHIQPKINIADFEISSN